ncbi:MAG: 1-deoxy-D-xylulose-5-phosphate reductoisomerase, partial [Halieaceae bacterium]
FEAPDLMALPCLALAQSALTRPGGMSAFSAANEVAVAAFLAGDIRFTDIDRVIASVLQSINLMEPDTLDAVQRLDADARDAATNCVTLMATPKTQS